MNPDTVDNLPASAVPYAVETAGPEDNNQSYMYRSTLPESAPVTTASPVDTFLGFFENAWNSLSPIARETGLLPPRPTPPPAPTPAPAFGLDPSIIGLVVVAGVALVAIKLMK